jgi:dTDP-4-amino-4,6-dideoxygalactose transaminase
MNNIQMVDLSNQYLKIKNEIDTAIQNVLEHTRFIKGGEVKLFETELADYLGCKQVIGCANGTDALQIALMALNLEPGDEVITSPFTFVATAEVIALLQLKPVFVDIEPGTFNIDPEKVKSVITDRTKAILPVHLFGQCADMKTLLEISEKHHLHVIEDNAQAIGADYAFKGNTVKSGTMGMIGTTSFFPSKNLGCFGDGGALYTNDSKLAEKIAAIANHGSKVKYYNDFIGVNSRLDTLQAGILRIKLGYLDNYIKSRQAAATYYDEQLSQIDEISIPKRNPDSTHVFHQYTIRIKDNKRDELKKYLGEHNIPSMVYYPLPLHKQKAYTAYASSKQDLHHAEQACMEVLSLPMHTELTRDQLTFITEAIINFF